ncbi:MAG: hypothetical protein ABIT37_22570 [Luteolibacter sp.]
MKIPLTLSALILAIGAALGWHDHQQLAAVRETHEKLVAEAELLGISVDPAHPSDSVRLTKRGERENKEAVAKEAVRDFIAFAKEMEEFEKQGKQPDEAMQKRIMEFMDRMMDLDASQIKFLITELRSNTELKEETRQGLIGFSIMTLANEHPQAALAIFTESSDLLGKNQMNGHMISSALSRWAKDDPAGALEWVRTNGAKFPDLVTDDAKRGLVSGAATNDPKLAFKLVGELGLTDKSQAISSIMSAAKTPEERTATFTAFREYLAGITDEKARDEAANSASWSLTRNVVASGFNSATQWIEKTKLTPDELAKFTDGLQNNVKSGETGQWIEWVGDKLPADKSKDVIRNMVSSWTQSDFQATGAWLNTAPAGPAKNTAIRSYAETVSRYEPEAAAQWAETLPPGEDRDQTLKRIYRNWPKKDDASKAAAEAFKSQYGVK